jgi:hypothetical protein
MTARKSSQKDWKGKSVFFNLSWSPVETTYRQAFIDSIGTHVIPESSVKKKIL